MWAFDRRTRKTILANMPVKERMAMRRHMLLARLRHQNRLPAPLSPRRRRRLPVIVESEEEDLDDLTY